MLHITQRSVERGLDFNQISLIQDKIRQFFFFLSRNVFALKLCELKVQKFCFEKKENYKSYQWEVFQQKWNAATELISHLILVHNT